MLQTCKRFSRWNRNRRHAITITIFCDASYRFLEGPLMQRMHYVAVIARAQQRHALRSFYVISIYFHLAHDK